MERSLRSSGDSDPPAEPSRLPGLPVAVFLAGEMLDTKRVADELAADGASATRLLVAQLRIDRQDGYRDETAFKLTIYVFGRGVKTYLRSFWALKTDPIAHESAFNDTFMRVAHFIDDFNSSLGVPLRGWIKNLAWSAISAEQNPARKQARQQQAFDDSLAAVEAGTRTKRRSGPDLERVLSLVGALPVADQTAILARAEGRSSAEIAERTGATTAAVERRTQRAIARVRDGYGQHPSA